jgi:hypothetical protein
MTSYRIVAQSFTSNHRITKTVQAVSELAVLRMVTVELENVGFYVASVKAI